MALQSNLYKFVNNITGFRNLLNNNKLLINHQHQASIKQTAKDKLIELNIPEKPKKPLTPFFRFVQDHRAEVVRKNPSFKLPEISRQCAADWAVIHETIKEKYSTEYKRELEVYSKKILEYNGTLSEEQIDAIKLAVVEKREDKKKRVLKKRISDAGRPKRPIGAYMQFVMDISKEQNKKLIEVLPEVKGKWQELPSSEKQKYILKYEEDKKRYENEMSIWESKMIKEGNVDLVRQISLKANTRVGTPKRVPKQPVNKKTDEKSTEKKE